MFETFTNQIFFLHFPYHIIQKKKKGILFENSTTIKLHNATFFRDITPSKHDLKNY